MGHLLQLKMCTFTLESTHFIFNKCPIDIHDGASAKFSTKSHESVYSVVLSMVYMYDSYGIDLYVYKYV